MNLQLKLVSESYSIGEALGVTDERAAELLEIMDEMHRDGKPIIDQLMASSCLVNHPNELAFIAYICGAANGRNEAIDEMIDHFNKFFDDENE